ncbi:DUF3055 domain-containing protein [Bacillus kwashiorkori]|uniref:DUF3055 domain-containing protein n=1 Tax=Bacillus kwashiorkori TaxID=1522318 RepID=UPI00078402DE|nr:DUF3055 domain-containing protein [Bacillus kwashiorkori]
MQERIFLYEFQENTNIRYVSFVESLQRFDLAIIQTKHFFGKLIVLDLQGNRFAVIGPDDLQEKGYLEEVFQLSKEAGTELCNFLQEIIY